jgi:hypothetical protein
MARVEIPAPGDLIMDTAGNVRVGVTVSLKLSGTATDATHYSALTGGTSTTGGLVSGSDGSVVDGSGNRRYVDSGIAMDMLISGRTKQLEPMSASAEAGVVYARGYGNTHAAINAACVAAAADGRTVRITGTWHLTNKVDVLSPVTIDCRGATIYQDTYGLPVFEVRTISGVTIRGGTYVNAQTKAVVTGPSHDIYPAREYAAVVYCYNAHRVHVDGARIENFVVGVKFGGDDSTYCLDNKVTNMTCDHLDFGVLVDKQDGLIVNNVQSRNIEMTQGTTPPHTVYTSGTSTRRCKNVTIKNVTTITCVSSGVKTKFVDGLNMSGIINDGCERGFDIEDCSGSATNIVVRNITENTIADPNQTAIDVLNCHNFTLADSAVDLGNADIPAVFCRSADPGPYCADITVQNVVVSSAYDGNAAGDTRYPFWSQGVTRGRWIGCTHRATGSDDKYMFGVSDGSISWTTPTTVPNIDCTIEMPMVSGSQKLAFIRANQTRTRLILDRALILDGVLTGTLTIRDDSSPGSSTRVVWRDPTPPYPDALSGLTAYFDARQATVAFAAGIGSLTGAPGTGTQATGTLQPLLTANRFKLATMPGIAFDGVDDRLPTDIAMPTSTLTVAFVARLTNFAANRKVSQTRSATTGLSIIATSGTALIRLLKGATTLATGTTALTADTAALVVVTVDIPNLLYAIRVNGVAAGSGALAGGTTLDAGSLDLGDATMLGSVGAYAVWNRVLSTSEIEQAEARLKLDWGIA